MYTVFPALHPPDVARPSIRRTRERGVRRAPPTPHNYTHSDEDRVRHVKLISGAYANPSATEGARPPPSGTAVPGTSILSPPPQLPGTCGRRGGPHRCGISARRSGYKRDFFAKPGRSRPQRSPIRPNRFRNLTE